MYNIVVFASGNGSTLQCMIDSMEKKDLNANISLFVTNKEDAFALERAKKHNIDTYVIKGKSPEEIDIELEQVLSKYNVDLIVLAGYIKLIGNRLLDKYTIINTHPSLLPKFGGKGMYGMNVHTAVIEAKEKISGVTMHFVNNHYDKGNIIRQTTVNVNENDTPETLSKKVQDVEKKQLIEVLKEFVNGQIKSN